MSANAALPYDEELQFRKKTYGTHVDQFESSAT